MGKAYFVIKSTWNIENCCGTSQIISHDAIFHDRNDWCDQGWDIMEMTGRIGLLQDRAWECNEPSLPLRNAKREVTPFDCNLSAVFCASMFLKLIRTLLRYCMENAENGEAWRVAATPYA